MPEVWECERIPNPSHRSLQIVVSGLVVMLHQNKGIVPQLVDQYNDLIEHKWYQTIGSLECRDNRSDSVNEVIDAVLSAAAAHTDQTDRCSRPDTSLAISVLREQSPRFERQIDEQVLGLFHLTNGF